MTQEEKIKVIRSWTQSFDIRNNHSGSITYPYRMEIWLGGEMLPRCATSGTKDNLITQAYQMVHGKALYHVRLILKKKCKAQ